MQSPPPQHSRGYQRCALADSAGAITARTAKSRVRLRFIPSSIAVSGRDSCRKRCVTEAFASCAHLFQLPDRGQALPLSGWRHEQTDHIHAPKLVITHADMHPAILGFAHRKALWDDCCAALGGDNKLGQSATRWKEPRDALHGSTVHVVAAFLRIPAVRGEWREPECQEASKEREEEEGGAEGFHDCGHAIGGRCRVIGTRRPKPGHEGPVKSV